MKIEAHEFSEFLEFRMDGKILAKFLTALIFSAP
jgi:hypothetical protein